VFGNETDGLPLPIRDKHADRVFRIPMTDAVRSLNLATAAGIVLYEAVHQMGSAKFGLLDRPPVPTARTD
jgi:tRNA (cytidine/uridine-2'-O-)-methyltransferase